MPGDPETSNTLGTAGRARSGAAGDVPDAIRTHYLIDEKGGPGLGFYVDATVRHAAFRDHGHKLSLERADPNAIRDATEIAKHRGWRIVTVKGSAEFRREAWLAGRQADLEVQGYRPSERDLQDLDRRLRRREQGARGGDRKDRAAGEPAGPRREDRRGEAQMSVVQTVVRARVSDEERQRAIIDRARQRIADWLERGARFEQAAERPRSPDRQRAR